MIASVYAKKYGHSSGLPGVLATITIIALALCIWHLWWSM